MYFPAASAPPKLFTLVLLSGLSVVSLNMFLPSLSNIAARFPGRLWAARERIDCRLCRDDDSAATADRAFIGQGGPAAGHPGESRDLCACVARLLAGDGCLDVFALSHDAGRDRLWVRAVARDHTGYRTCAESGKPHGLSIHRVGNRTNVGPDARRSIRSTIWLARELLGFPWLWRGHAGLVLVRSRRDQQEPVRDFHETV